MACSDATVSISDVVLVCLWLASDWLFRRCVFLISLKNPVSVRPCRVGENSTEMLSLNILFTSMFQIEFDETSPLNHSNKSTQSVKSCKAGWSWCDRLSPIDPQNTSRQNSWAHSQEGRKRYQYQIWRTVRCKQMALSPDNGISYHQGWLMVWIPYDSVVSCHGFKQHPQNQH